MAFQPDHEHTETSGVEVTISQTSIDADSVSITAYAVGESGALMEPAYDSIELEEISIRVKIEPLKPGEFTLTIKADLLCEFERA
ncbi:hypothetical protein WKR88_12840 [Trinickia caryophylli]|uniref:Uncharacterized protein n=1 Tax=Trinickia caryophylli TaxID=28094 RepID=A0A1X7H4F8_TRICW|nr:hypothetical protein [Trinickia caryophylli]PMS08827.1 hypothetical protein C0Z17_28110 [Trinickia caryophylli]TRX17318.1 hypothetical protein FNF07_03100 [Trinickia caryophylli]WQE11942.1 hypothetical protein U0034_00465 [Trinickia caryophylli]SMF79380.1 hypothetical protein SAMN06295900_12118 [Trinickia caryophylli]GLU35668.1 hypothetical protein Busp01_55100 [Trinickia caryophylli]